MNKQFKMNFIFAYIIFKINRIYRISRNYNSSASLILCPITYFIMIIIKERENEIAVNQKKNGKHPFLVT